MDSFDLLSVPPTVELTSGLRPTPAAAADVSNTEEEEEENAAAEVGGAEATAAFTSDWDAAVKVTDPEGETVEAALALSG